MTEQQCVDCADLEDKDGFLCMECAQARVVDERKHNVAMLRAEADNLIVQATRLYGISSSLTRIAQRMEEEGARRDHSD